MTALVKICGLTTAKDALLAAACGADCLGFVLYARSPRYCAPETIRTIVTELPSAIRKIGVFVDTPATEVVAMLEYCGLDMAQLHGNEPPNAARVIGTERVWKAFGLSTAKETALARDFPAAALVVDAVAPVQRGGTGTLGDWALAAELARRRRVILAGGLTPTNVAAGIRAVRPHGVDVSSGVENAPGKKDHALVRAFVSAAQSVKLPN